KATAEHHFLTERGWVRLKDMAPNHDKLLFKTDGCYGRRVCADCGVPLKSMHRHALRCKGCAARITSNPSKPEAREKIRQAHLGKRPLNHHIDATHQFYGDWVSS